MTPAKLATARRLREGQEHTLEEIAGVIGVSRSTLVRHLARPEALGQWGRAVGTPVVVPLAALEPHPDRAEVIRHLREARQKIDGADYPGSFAEARKALELLRGMESCDNPPTGPPGT